MDDEPPLDHNFISKLNDYYKDLLGYRPKETSLKTIPKENWDEFILSKELNQNSQGIYLPRNQTSIIPKNNKLSLFHEYFGHGLYCEQSLTGRRLVDLEKKLLEEEKLVFQNKDFSLNELKRFRIQNKTFLELEYFRLENLGRYELFAIWTEYLLSGEHGLREQFGIKYNSLESQEKEAVDSVINFSEQYGNLATMYAQGMARRTTTERVKKLLKDIYGDELIKNSKLILLTGSKKPFSDIDLFASSNHIASTKNNWLDLVSFNEKDFEKRIKLFEVQVTHPIMSGEFVAGDKNYLQQKRKQLKEQPITEDVINHNFRKSEQERIASKETSNKELRRVYDSYSQTYLANALALKQGLRLFTKEDLLLYSQDEKVIELKGGIMK